MKRNNEKDENQQKRMNGSAAKMNEGANEKNKIPQNEKDRKKEKE